MGTEDQAKSAGASQGAIEHHYDVGNDFYALWLDSQLVYSCALYDDPDASVDEAQSAKLRYWLDELSLGHEARLLDIGCGWGAMLNSARSRHPGLAATGLTLSTAQFEHVRLQDIKVELTSWEDYSPEGTFTGIVSLGAFEHFARDGMTRAGRVERYRSFFARCFHWLEPGARLALQTIALDDQPERTGEGLGQYFVEDVFPESSLPRLGEVIQAAEEHFSLLALRIDPDHYAKTCREWRHRLHRNKAAAVELVGKEITDHYSKLLFLSEREFLTRSATLYRFTFQRRAEVVSSVRG